MNRGFFTLSSIWLTDLLQKQILRCPMTCGKTERQSRMQRQMFRTSFTRTSMSTMAWFPAVHLQKPLICLPVHNVFYMTTGNLGYTSSLQITGKCWTQFHRVSWLRISVTSTFVMTRYQCREV